MKNKPYSIKDKIQYLISKERVTSNNALVPMLTQELNALLSNYFINIQAMNIDITVNDSIDIRQQITITINAKATQILDSGKIVQ